jgi:RHS repeat-associated protein
MLSGPNRNLQKMLFEETITTYKGRGEGRIGQVISQRRGGTSHFLLADALGTTTRLLDASENVTDTYVMDAFGDPVATSGSTTNPFRYVGGLGYYSEGDPALSYVRSRWLRPTTGSWLSVDPVEGEARYQYVGHSPVNATDGSGRDGCIYCATGRPHPEPMEPTKPIEPAKPVEPTKPPGRAAGPSWIVCRVVPLVPVLGPGEMIWGFRWALCCRRYYWFDGFSGPISCALLPPPSDEGTGEGGVTDEEARHRKRAIGEALESGHPLNPPPGEFPDYSPIPEGPSTFPWGEPPNAPWGRR